MTDRMLVKRIECEEMDIIISSAIAFQLILMTCKNSLVSTSVFFFNINTPLNVFCWCCILGNYARILIFKKAFSVIPFNSFVVFVVLMLFCLVSHAVNPELFVSRAYPYDYVWKSLIEFLGYSLPIFFFSSALKNPSLLLCSFYRNCWLLFGVETIGFLLFISGGAAANEYSMTFGNTLLFSFFVLSFCIYNEKKFYYIIPAGILIVYTLLCGSRGPLLSIAALLFCFILSMKSNLKKYLIFFVCGTFIMSFLLQYESIVMELISFLEKFGIKSRTLSMIIYGNITSDSGRSLYFDQVFEALNNSPVLGLGAFGGNAIVGLTHSLYLDIWANFGYFAGSFLMCFIFYNLVKIAKDEPNFRMIILFYSIMVFPRGFSAYQFWGAKEIWILLGLIVSYYSSRKIST